MKIFWLSFVDDDLPKNHKFLGVCIVKADDIASAVATAWKCGCNPGGEILGIEFPEGTIVPNELMYHLMSKSEAAVADAWITEIN